MTSVPIPGILGITRSTGRDTWTLATNIPTRALAMAASTGRKYQMFGVIAVLGPGIQFGGTLSNHLPNNRGEGGITVLYHPGWPPNHSNMDASSSKAIHLEVDYAESYKNCQCLHSAFSSQAKVLASGIKMQLVEEVQSLTNPLVCHQASQLCMLHAKFLVNSETGMLHMQPHLAHKKAKHMPPCSSFSQDRPIPHRPPNSHSMWWVPWSKKRASLFVFYFNIVTWLGQSWQGSWTFFLASRRRKSSQSHKAWPSQSHTQTS